MGRGSNKHHPLWLMRGQSGGLSKRSVEQGVALQGYPTVYNEVVQERIEDEGEIEYRNMHAP